MALSLSFRPNQPSLYFTTPAKTETVKEQSGRLSEQISKERERIHNESRSHIDTEMHSASLSINTVGNSSGLRAMAGARKVS
jgi:hypothetical protein